ncbi:polysaccharide biosynthesis tyrosine autokinase [Spongisporangium articulatum]|uniref:non-specific protein-tyrosine kinase n=1 Tax=Spongisporangium articulatum TaxID=3362603 RepID=A0ABW8AUA1_9ACTN
MAIADHLRVLRRYWWIPLLTTIASVAAAAWYSFTVTPTYTASTQLFVATALDDSSAGDLSQGSTFVQQRVKSYADIVTSEQVMLQVRAALGLDESTAHLAGRIDAETPLDTVLLTISAMDSSPQQAAAVANATASAFGQFVTQLETPQGATESPVTVQTTRPATAPVAPTSPRIPLNLALGLLAGLALGVGSAVLRDRTNSHVESAADVEEVTGAVPLGLVPHDRTATRRPLVDLAEQSGRAEAYRGLRTNLLFTGVDRPATSIVVTSPLPGDGKSTTAANLALTLAMSGARVALVEADLRKPAVSRYLGLSHAVGLTNVLAGQHELRDVMAVHTGPDGRELIAVLPSGPTPPNPSELLGSAQMAKLLAMLTNHYDYVVIDAPPLLPVTDAAVLGSTVDGVVMVARHRVTGRDQLAQAHRALTALNARVLGTVLNGVPAKGAGGYQGYGYGASARGSAPTPIEPPTLGRPSILVPDQALARVPEQRGAIDLTAHRPGVSDGVRRRGTGAKHVTGDADTYTV